MEGLQKCRAGCGQEKTLDQFGLKIDGTHYKHCIDCREKKEYFKRNELKRNDLEDSIDNNITEEMGDKNNDKGKKETRPVISQQKQSHILKQQDYDCRGPGKGECEFYECDMKINKKKFGNNKSVFPQFDHIIRWKEGGNKISNIQALCPNCHHMKTAYENLEIDNGGDLEDDKVAKSILESLRKPKKENKINYDSDSDDEYIFRKIRRF